MLNKRFISISLLIAGILLNPAAAQANNPPDPFALGSVYMMPPLLAVCMALGGAFALLAATKKPVRRSIKALVLGMLLILGFLSLGMELFTSLVWLIFVIVGIRYSAAMIVWGIKARRPPEQRQPFLRNANSHNLLIYGIAAILLMSLSSHVFFSFIGRYPTMSNQHNAFKLHGLLQYELQYAQRIRNETGKAAYDAPTDSGDQASMFPCITFNRSYFSFWSSNIEFKLAPDHRAYKIWVWPNSFPTWPYNHLISLPSYFADQTGQIRRIYVHSPEKCPEDAPVVDIVKNGFAVQDQPQ